MKRENVDNFRNIIVVEFALTALETFWRGRQYDQRNVFNEKGNVLLYIVLSKLPFCRILRQ